MKRSELFEAAREILADPKPQEKISDEQLLRHFNDAIDEACRRTRSIEDSRSPLCSLRLRDGIASYQLDRSIFAVRRIVIEGQRLPLEIITAGDLDFLRPGWDNIDNKTLPRYAMFDIDTGRVTFSPTPDGTYTAKLMVWRCPTDEERLSLDKDCEPALPRHMHRELKHWVCGMCYLNEDSEIKDGGQAATQIALFDAAYGEKPDHHEMRLWSCNRRQRVRAHFD